MAWRQEQEGHLTTKGKQIYERGMRLLAGEIAAVQGIDLAQAEIQVRAKIREGLTPVKVM